MAFGVFCLFCCKIGWITLIDYINFAYLAVLLTKECIIELFPKKLNLFTNKSVRHCRALSNYEVLMCSASLQCSVTDAAQVMGSNPGHFTTECIPSVHQAAEFGIG